jgi:hypothetical protein
VAIFGETPGGREAGARLLEFVDGTQKTLGDVVRDGRDPIGNSLFVPSLVPAMQRAWDEMPGEFDRLRSELNSLSNIQIANHGFTTAQLNFKLGVIAHWWQRFSERGGRWIFRKLLEAIDNVLDSLIDALGVGGAIKEMKEAILSASDDEESK